MARPEQVIAKFTIRFSDNTSTTVVTDTSWTWSDGPIITNDIYNGETYDARLEELGWDAPGYHAAGWREAHVVAAPAGTLIGSTLLPIRIVQTINPVRLSEPRAATYVFDLGQNVAGWARVHASGPDGTRIQLRYSEDIGADGMFDRRTNRAALATDTFILARSSAAQTYEPRFTYHGFRFIEVTGYPGVPTLASLDGRVAHADVASIGTFHSSDSLLNQIHDNARRTMLNNSMSIPTDNPVRDDRSRRQDRRPDRRVR